MKGSPRNLEPRTSNRDVRREPYDLCAFCPDLCLDRCPVVEATGSSAFSPHAKMLSGWLKACGGAASGPDLARLAFQCTGCQACHEACEHGEDVASALFRLRAEWTQAGLSPYDRSLFTEGVTSTKDLLRAQARAIPRRYFVPEAQAVLFPGCRALREDAGGMRDVLFVFQALGIEFVGASEAAAVCCGYPLVAGGLRDDFGHHAHRVSDALRRFRLVVALSPCCAHTMKNLYLEAGVENPPRVTTALEIAAPLVMRTRREPLPLAVAYHDSCFLGRHMGLYSLPREVLAHVLGMPPLELRRAREEAPCCGAGGAWDRVAPADAKAAGLRILALAEDSGADGLVSASPSCLSHIRSALGAVIPRRPPRDLEVMDLFHLLARWLGSPPARSKRGTS